MLAVTQQSFGDADVPTLVEIARPVPLPTEILVRVRAVPHVAPTFPLAGAAKAHRLIEGGHSTGRVVLTLDDVTVGE